MITVAELTIPNRYESLEQLFGQEVRPLIVPIDTDLRQLNALRDRARTQNGGLLCFVLGATGVGKTTSIHAAAIHMPDDYAPVLKVPLDIDLRDAMAWLTASLPAPITGKTRIVLFDGREVTDDDVGLKQFLSGLNQCLRRRADLLFCWPTTDADWWAHVRGIAEGIGGANFAPAESDIQIAGPPAGEWPLVLERLLLQFGKTYADVGVASDLINGLCAAESTVGGFLGRIGAIVADRITKTRETKRLPQLVFVVTSSGDVVGEANRIRRAGTQMLAPEPLLGHSPRSEAGTWWAERNKSASTHLGYVISLFDARLVTMSASAVVYACMHHDDGVLQAAAVDEGARPDKGNAQRVISVSEFYRFLVGEQIPEFTSGKKGSVGESTMKGYAAVQGMSAKRHKLINQTLCRGLREYLPDLTFDDEKDFEVAHGGDLITDAQIKYRTMAYSLEFHHLSEAQCGAAAVSSYIMDKLRTYAWYHQIVPR